jgi:2-amino-4-hydroxy-6-hydroxymethyldihydropteridine diphosphokinase
LDPERPEVAAFLALGANLGDRLANLQAATDALDATPGVRVVRSSRVYETDPVGPPQPDYLNAVIEVRTRLEPHRFLETVLRVERDLGRVRGERWGPRTIDIDVLTFDALVLDDPSLTLPHPRMHERAFVLIPLLELDPDPQLPGGRHIERIRTASGGLSGVRLVAPALSLQRRRT